MNVIETDRLILRHLTTDDAVFILALVNDPSWLQFIGDNGVRTLERSANLLEKLGLHFERLIILLNDAQALRLFATSV